MSDHPTLLGPRGTAARLVVTTSSATARTEVRIVLGRLENRLELLVGGKGYGCAGEGEGAEGAGTGGFCCLARRAEESEDDGA